MEIIRRNPGNALSYTCVFGVRSCVWLPRALEKRKTAVCTANDTGHSYMGEFTKSVFERGRGNDLRARWTPFLLKRDGRRRGGSYETFWKARVSTRRALENQRPRPGKTGRLLRDRTWNVWQDRNNRWLHYCCERKRRTSATKYSVT